VLATGALARPPGDLAAVEAILLVRYRAALAYAARALGAALVRLEGSPARAVAAADAALEAAWLAIRAARVLEAAGADDVAELLADDVAGRPAAARPPRLSKEARYQARPPPTRARRPPARPPASSLAARGAQTFRPRERHRRAAKALAAERDAEAAAAATRARERAAAVESMARDPAVPPPPPPPFVLSGHAASLTLY
jgi:hypothetical protein